MNILFITMWNKLNNIDEHNIYADLLRTFVNKGDHVYVVSPEEKRVGKETHIIYSSNCCVLKVRTGNLFNVGMIEKGISQVMIGMQYIKAIKTHFDNIHFNLILYSTPPITITNVVRYVKKRDNAITYLLLKDIFPQNAVDIGLMRKNSVLYKYFRNVEKQLYNISDYIGCMSPANIDYICRQNPELASAKIEINPNSIEPIDKSILYLQRQSIREKYCIPKDKIVFVYGGNLGKPQNIPFIISCLKVVKEYTNNYPILNKAYFIIVGNGTEYTTMNEYISVEKPGYVQLIKELPKDQYDALVGSCDIGMIFLDDRFTIPNYPSRLLGYMAVKIPVLCVTDKNSDVGSISVNNDYGWWCESKDPNDVAKILIKICELQNTNVFETMGENGFRYLENNYSTEQSYKTIANHFIKKS